MAKPKPTERTNPSVSDMLAHEQRVKAARQATWAGWLDECAAMQDAFVEGMLDLLPSKRG